LVVSVLLAAGVARAENRELARESFHEGSLQYDLGDFRAALNAFKRAYLNFEDPVILFNIAQCQRHLGDKADALRSFRVFLMKVPDAKERPQVERLIAELQAAIDQDKNAATRPPMETMGPSRPLETERTAPAAKPPEVPPAEPQHVVPPPEPAPPAPSTEAKRAPAPLAIAPAASPPDQGRGGVGRKLKIAGVALMVVGAAGIAVGGAFVGLASAADHDYLHPSNGLYSPTAESQRQLYQTLDVTFLAIGGAAAVAGLASLIAGHQLAHSWSLAAMATPQQASLSLTGNY
jgi:tetratricopeptide (TPR) repeat protein